jgi:hypothetical protein
MLLENIFLDIWTMLFTFQLITMDFAHCIHDDLVIIACRLNYKSEIIICFFSILMFPNTSVVGDSKWMISGWNGSIS